MNNENSNMQVKKIAYRNWFGAYSKPRETLTFLTGKKQKDDTKEEINSNDYSFNKLFDAFLFAFALAAKELNFDDIKTIDPIGKRDEGYTTWHVHNTDPDGKLANLIELLYPELFTAESPFNDPYTILELLAKYGLEQIEQKIKAFYKI